MNIRELEIDSHPEGIKLSANGSITNFDNPHWHTNIHHLSINAKTIDFISRNMNLKEIQLPDAITRLGDVFFSGEAGGVGSTLSTKGILKTDAGNANIGIGLRDDKN